MSFVNCVNFWDTFLRFAGHRNTKRIMSILEGLKNVGSVERELTIENHTDTKNKDIVVRNAPLKQKSQLRGRKSNVISMSCDSLGDKWLNKRDNRT